METQIVLNALTQIRRMEKALNEFIDLSQQIAQSLDRDDMVAVRMLLTMRRESVNEMRRVRRTLQRQARMVHGQENREHFRSLLNSSHSGNTEEERTLADRVAASVRLQNRATELDRVLSQKMARDRSFYLTK